MKDYLHYLLILIISLIVFDRSMSFLLDELLQMSNFRFVNLQDEDPDFFVLGNSRGVNSVKESQFDSDFCLDVFNISYNGLNPDEMKYLITKINTTKPILIEVSPFLEYRRSISNPLDLYDTSIGSKRFSVFKNLRTEKFDFLNLYRFNNELFFRSLYYIFTSDKSWGNNKVLDPVKKNILLKKEKQYEISVDYLIDFVNFLDKYEVNYLLYYAPLHPEKKKLILNWDIVNEDVARLSKGKYLDLSDLITHDSSFADFLHTNGREQNLIHNSIYKFLIHNGLACSDH